MRRASSRRRSSTTTGEERAQFASGEPVLVRLLVEAERGVAAPRVVIELRDDDGVVLGHVSQELAPLGWNGGGRHEVSFRLDRLPLAEGRFHLRVALADATTGALLHALDDALRFFVFPAGDGVRRRAAGRGLVDAGDRPGRANSGAVSARACPDWPALMEIAPDLQFRHVTLGEARLPVDAFVQLAGIGADDIVALLRSRRARVQPRAHGRRASSRRCAARTGSTSARSPSVPPRESVERPRVEHVGRRAPAAPRSRDGEAHVLQAAHRVRVGRARDRHAGADRVADVVALRSIRSGRPFVSTAVPVARHAS